MKHMLNSTKTVCFLSTALTSTILLLAQSPPSQLDAGRKQFQSRCALCHGGDARGGERGPNIVEGQARNRSVQELRTIIRNGVPGSGMPAFKLPAGEEADLIAFVHSLSAPAAEGLISGDVRAGKAFFWGKGHCGDCHTIWGRGGLMGPDLSAIGRQRTLPEIEQSMREPGATPGYQVVVVTLTNGRSIRGFARNESNYDLELQGLDGEFYRLQRNQIAEITREGKPLMPPFQASADEFHDLLAYIVSPQPFEPAMSSVVSKPENWRPDEWPTYDGRFDGNRHSFLNQITVENVSRLGPRWMFPVPDAKELEVTPLVVDGMMYVTSGNEVFALDARNGRRIWEYERPRNKAAAGEPATGVNRGVAIGGDRLFVGTPNAHLLALSRINGGLVWDAELADYRQQYSATAAPLVVNDLVLYGIAGGIRGFIDAYKISNGKRVWRFSAVPAPGEPRSETWVGRGIEHPCTATWMNGTYDPNHDIVYWTTGNPCPEFNGDDRKGDNLYSDSVLALKPTTGELLWYFQFTPHDVHDWDAQETPVLVDTDFHGQKRHLMLHADRNGFFYVLDRISGKLLLAKPFVDKLTWASDIGPDGRPKVLRGTDNTVEGTKVCPSVEGATNWMSSAWNPETRLFYVMALEKCSIYKKWTVSWEPGEFSDGGETREVPGEPGQKILRAIEIQTGRRVWEYPQKGPADSWGGVLSTAGGLVFLCDDSGAFAAVDGKTGKPLWHFHTNQRWHSSPMTYLADGQQYVAVASGSNIIAFGL